MVDELKVLVPGARILLTPEFLAGRAKPDLSDHVRSTGFDRTIDVRLVGTLLERVMSDARFAGKPELSDGWLAPRIHAVLRLRRREASDRRVWTWLAVVAFPDYVRWRFPGDAEGGTAIKRFIGQDRDNALSRLWWGAEMTRNGADYNPTVRAFERQDVPNTWFALNAFHHPAAAQAALAWLPGMTSDDINKLAKAFNHYLTTVMLDAVAEAPAPDEGAIEDWIHGEPDEAYLIERLPEGPEEDPVPPSAIEAVRGLVKSVAADVGLELPEKAA